MHYLGIPTCPYCKKRVNIIRTWSLKRQGEYQCPRCGGISNIFLSPLVYVLALLALFSGGAMYFFHKFVLEDIALETAIYVFIPFAVFFLFSLFMVYLEKPVIKKVSKEEYQKKRRIRSAVEGSAGAVSRQEEKHGHYEEDDYVPRGSYRPGPEGAISDAPRQGVVNQAAFSRAKIQAAAENTQHSERLAAYPRQSSQPQRQRPVSRTPADGGAYRPRQPQPRAQQQPTQSRPAANRAPAPHQTVARPAAGQGVEPSKNGYPPRRPQGQAAAPRRDIK